MNYSNKQNPSNLSRDILIKQLQYRSLNRGCKELDLIIGDFANANLHSMDVAELLEYQQILDLNDHYFYNYLLSALNQQPADAGHVMQKIIKFVKAKAA